MYDEWINEAEEEERIRRHKARIQEMRRRKRRAEILQKRVFPAALAAFFIIAAAGIGMAVKGKGKEPGDAGETWTADGGTASGEMQADDAADSGEVQVDGAAVMGEERTDGGTATEGAQTDGAAASGGEQTDGVATSGGEQTDGTAASEENPGEGDPAVLSQAGTGQTGENLGKAGRRRRSQQPESEGEIYGPFLPPEAAVFSATADSGTADFPEEIISRYGILIDVERETVIAQREGRSRMYPASMTKILTVLTAARALGIDGEDWQSAPVLDEKFTITIEITDYSFVNECSNVGFEVGEEVTVRDLFYGTILSSGADAALGLAYYVAGSQEAFVELMNQELERLKLAGTTHFTNCVGLYDAEHYSTVYDMAVILKTAADNPFCRAVLSARTYNTSFTAQHPEGLLISNWYLRQIEDRDTHGEVLCGKTGYVVQSGNCAASLARDANGREYICVTAGALGTKSRINDHVALYQTWLTE